MKLDLFIFWKVYKPVQWRLHVFHWTSFQVLSPDVSEFSGSSSTGVQAQK